MRCVDNRPTGQSARDTSKDSSLGSVCVKESKAALAHGADERAKGPRVAVRTSVAAPIRKRPQLTSSSGEPACRGKSRGCEHNRFVAVVG